MQSIFFGGESNKRSQGGRYLTRLRPPKADYGEAGSSKLMAHRKKDKKMEFLFDGIGASGSRRPWPVDDVAHRGLWGR